MSDEIVNDDQAEPNLETQVEDNDAKEQETDVSAQETEQNTDSGDEAPPTETSEDNEGDASETNTNTFTQGEVDKIVSERLGRQEKKLKRDLSRSAELQANTSTEIDNSIIFDPDTGMPIDANDERYKSIKAQRDTQNAIEYNNQLNAQRTELEKMQREEQKLVMEAESGFEDQLIDLQSSDSESYDLLKKENLLSKPQCFGMVQAISDNPKGVAVLAELIKTDYNEAIRISNLPYSKQLLEMAKLVHIKSKGVGNPIVKSDAPPPVESFGSGIGTAVNKSAEEMSFDELTAATRKRNKYLY